jgi:hypothetical protein
VIELIGGEITGNKQANSGRSIAGVESTMYNLLSVLYGNLTVGSLQFLLVDTGRELRFVVGQLVGHALNFFRVLLVYQTLAT